jgi:hypothetical protein
MFDVQAQNNVTDLDIRHGNNGKIGSEQQPAYLHATQRLQS